MNRNLIVYPLFALFVAAGHYFSNVLGGDAVGAVSGVACSSGLLFANCAYPADNAFNPAAYGALAAFLGAAMLFVGVKRRDSVIFPAVLLFGGLGLAAMAYDLVTGAGVIRHAAIINSLVNALSLGLLAGLLLVPLLALGHRLSLLNLSGAALVTFAGKIAALVLFAVLEPLFRGAAELWLLYFLFLFGAFNLHVAAISAAFAPLDNRAVAPPPRVAPRSA